jgi:hypothetical protein
MSVTYSRILIYQPPPRPLAAPIQLCTWLTTTSFSPFSSLARATGLGLILCYSTTVSFFIFLGPGVNQGTQMNSSCDAFLHFFSDTVQYVPVLYYFTNYLLGRCWIRPPLPHIGSRSSYGGDLIQISSTVVRIHECHRRVRFENLLYRRVRLVIAISLVPFMYII